MSNLQHKLQQKLQQNRLMKQWLNCVLLVGLSLLSSCASHRPAGELTEIIVLDQGKSIKQKPKMIDACKGFYVTPQKLKNFFRYASLTHEEQASSNYAKLPCYARGTAYLGNEEIQWVLRAGGVGEFYNAQKSFTKICGISCCDNVQGVC
jgi:hypothetical protein